MNENIEKNNHSYIIIFCFITFITICISHIISKHKYLFVLFPHPIVALIIGITFGYIIRCIFDTSLGEIFLFHGETFFFLLLPPIIFNAGYHLNKTNFFSNIHSIMLLAIFGTIINASIIGIIFYHLQIFPLKESLAFGSILSSIDPISILTVFKFIHVNKNIYQIVFGESMLNDAVAILLYHIFNTSNFQKLKENNLFNVVIFYTTQFICIFFVSILIGLFIGFISALFFKYTKWKKEQQSHELFVFFIFCYLAYIIPELFGLSGIISLFFNGIIQSHYTSYNFSNSSLQDCCKIIFEMFSDFTETIIYLYIGLALFTFRHLIDQDSIFWGILGCVLGRAFNIFILCFIMNLWRKEKIFFSYQVIMWFSGLRGSVTFALSLSISTTVIYHRSIITCTLFIVIITTLFFGIGTYPIIKLMTKQRKYNDDDMNYKNKEREEENVTINLITNIDKKYLIPFLCVSNKNNIKNIFLTFDVNKI